MSLVYVLQLALLLLLLDSYSKGILLVHPITDSNIINIIISSNCIFIVCCYYPNRLFIKSIISSRIIPAT